MKKLVIERTKPRNPLVAPSMKKKAGVHRKAYKAVRKKYNQDLNKNIETD
jgi:hypothetical protein